MSNDNQDGSFLTSVISAASSTASSIAGNLSDRLNEHQQESQPRSSGEETKDKPLLPKTDTAKDLPSTENMNLNKRNSGRMHSHTISGDRPLMIVTNPRLSASPQRRNSDGGSPGLTLPMLGDNLQPSAPTATTATSETAIFSSTAPSLSLEHLQLKPSNALPDTGIVNSARSDTPVVSDDLKTPIADPETPVTKDMLLVPKKKPRPRGSSVSTAQPADGKTGVSLSRSNSGASRKATSRRKDSDDTDVDNLSEGAYSAAAGSIASACGMELANAKRNNDYHALFRSVPEEDVLIEDYGCALQKEILVQGRMYISEMHVCFNANIFGWVTNLVIAFTEIVAIEKRMTAKFIPNAIQISTLHSKHLFASFLSRDQAYDQLVDIWHVAHPNLISRTLKAKIGGSDEDEVDGKDGKDDSDSYSEDETVESGSEYDSDEYTEVSEEEEEEEEGEKYRTDRQDSVRTLPLPSSKHESEQESRRRAVSDLPSRPNPKDLLKLSKADANREKQASSAEDSGVDKSNGAAPCKIIKHVPTECSCGKNGEHYPSVALDEIYTGTLETINNLLYNSGFTKKFLVEKEKCTDVNIGNWEKGQGDGKFTRESNYIKYLGGSIGPKTTKCILKDEVVHFDLDDYITQITTTQTPDVPSGSSFCVKTRTCLTWAGDNKVRVLVTFSVEFSKSSWLKSTIEKASADGQVAYFKSLDEAVRKYIKQHPNEFHAAGGKYLERGEKKTRKKRRRRDRSKEKGHGAAGTTEPEKRGLMQKLLSPFLFISGILWSGIKFLIENAQIPTAQHITMLFMLLMLVVSLFAAKKMADMERQLEILASEMQVFPSQGMWIGNSERDQVWQWLIEKDGEGLKHQARSDVPLPTGNAMRSKAAATLNSPDLDQEITQLGMQVQEAQKRLEQLSQQK